ncbi:unnamed protein product [Protopolystoma xenopodis]|uniref:Uncharacterized protein n=1 Tax=Protopolystoma xenopodis TaxID=117903 RepID=A0A3S5FF63_9PLAT|nr:unnamed protein product [Protopolystoma xenopodis]
MEERQWLVATCTKSQGWDRIEAVLSGSSFEPSSRCCCCNYNLHMAGLPGAETEMTGLSRGPATGHQVLDGVADSSRSASHAADEAE